MRKSAEGRDLRDIEDEERLPRTAEEMRAEADAFRAEMTELLGGFNGGVIDCT